MLISRFPPIVFFAVPKTGSVSIETAFAPYFDMVMSKNPNLKHMPVRTYEASLANFVTRRVAKDPEKIAVMREPLDWVLSWWRYRMRSELEGKLRFAHDGVEMLDYLNQRGKFEDSEKNPRPTVILLDLNMPRMDGREALKALKGDKAFASIPVVVLTTSNQQEDVEQAYGLGVNAFVTKPVKYNALVEIMKRINEFWFDVATVPRPQQIK